MSYSKKPFCKVCSDAGKSEAEYSSHWVKDLQGKIICPTLLSTECRYCYKLGHTTKFCPALKKETKKKYDIKVVSKREKVGCGEKIVLKNDNAFAGLSDDSDEEVEEESSSVPVVQVNTLYGWAAVAAKKPETICKPEVTPAPWAKNIQTKPKSWADLSDSDSEEDSLAVEYDCHYSYDFDNDYSDEECF